MNCPKCEKSLAGIDVDRHNLECMPRKGEVERALTEKVVVTQIERDLLLRFLDEHAPRHVRQACARFMLGVTKNPDQRYHPQGRRQRDVVRSQILGVAGINASKNLSLEGLSLEDLERLRIVFQHLDGEIASLRRTDR